jgi:4-amino-4-deoxy-L-arabinose transferase-like glycosyltransferase
MDAIARRPEPSHLGPATLLFICIAIASVAIAIDISAANLSQTYDEGVYWQSLRAMSAGYHLYEQIFYSQPPLFLMSIYPFYELLGSTITSARVGVATLSLLGLPGAYLIGKALAGRAAGIAAVVLLIVTPIYLEQSHILRAEGPATGLLFLTIGAALAWWEHPTGRRGMAFAALCAVTLALGILVKLLDVTAVVPIALLVLARIWHIRHETNSNIWVSLRPIGAAMVAAVIVTLIILAPYLGSLNALVQQVVKFHLAAKKMMIASESENVHTLGQFFFANRVLATAAIIGVAVAVMRRDWRIVPLLAWFLTTLILLRVQLPLWPRHAIVLIPPLIAIVVLGLKGLPAIPMGRPIAWEQRGALLMGLLVFAVVILSLRHDYRHYRDLLTRAPSAADHWMIEVAADLQRVTTPDQWTITDAQYAAALANRDTPPWLVDTSITRVFSGYLTSQELQQAAADARVHAVVFGTNHLTTGPVATFHSWIAEHFSLRRTYGDGIELWTR